MLKRKDTITNEEKQKIQKLETKYDIIEEDKEIFENHVTHFKKYSLEILKQKTENFSIDSKKKPKKELVVELGYIRFLISKLPIDTRLLIISFLTVQIDTSNWIIHEKLRIKYKKDIGQNPFFKDCFGYFDSSKHPYFLYQNIIRKDNWKDDFVYDYSEESEISEDSLKAYIELYKCIFKYSQFIDHEIGNYLLNIHPDHWKIVKNFKFKNIQISLFNGYKKVLESIDLSNVSFLICKECSTEKNELYDLSEFHFPNLKSLKLERNNESITLTSQEQDKILDFISTLNLVNLELMAHFKNRSKLLKIIQSQSNLKYLAISLNNESELAMILKMSLNTLVLDAYLKVTEEINFHKDLRRIQLSLWNFETWVSHINSIQNIEVFEILNYEKFENTEILEKFLNLCNEKGLTLKTKTSFSQKLQKKYKNIYYA